MFGRTKFNHVWVLSSLCMASIEQLLFRIQAMSLEDVAGNNAGRNSSNHLSDDAPPPSNESTEVRQNILNNDELTAPHGHHDDNSSSSAGSVPLLTRREDSSASENHTSEAMQNHTIKVVGDKNFRYSPYLMGLAMNQYLRGRKTAYGSIPPLARWEDSSASEDNLSAVSVDHSLTLARAKGVPTAVANTQTTTTTRKKVIHLDTSTSAIVKLMH